MIDSITDGSRLISMKPTVSVVMPTRGRHALVERAITSVLKQTFTHFELLILDHSSPNEGEEIRKVSAADSRINYLDRGNIGLTPARKLGADLAVGKLLALMDSDDFWAPERLERHVEVWNHNLIGLSWDRWARSYENGRSVFPQPFSPGLIPAPKVAMKLYSWNFIHASAGIVSTDFARKEGFPILEITSSDWPLFITAAETYASYFIGETLSYTDETSPERVTNAISRKHFLREERMVRRWFLTNRPGTYAIPYLKTKLNRIRRKTQPRN